MRFTFPKWVLRQFLISSKVKRNNHMIILRQWVLYLFLWSPSTMHQNSYHTKIRLLQFILSHSGSVPIYIFLMLKLFYHKKFDYVDFFWKIVRYYLLHCTRIQICIWVRVFLFVLPEWGEYLEIVIAALHSSPHNTKVNEAEKSWTHKPATARQEALSFYGVNKAHWAGWQEALRRRGDFDRTTETLSNRWRKGSLFSYWTIFWLGKGQRSTPVYHCGTSAFSQESERRWWTEMPPKCIFPIPFKPRTLQSWNFWEFAKSPCYRGFSAVLLTNFG